MNRKKVSKIKKAVEKAVNSLHPLDDPLSWLTDTPPCPWQPKQIAEFQRKLDSAFGAENAYVLAWSLDKTFWDEFYVDWHVNGEPKGRPEKKPILLFKTVPVNETDYIYISTPRWLILERLHPSQLAESWIESSYVDDPDSMGGKKRIRTEHPPQAFYRIVRTIARHEQTVVQGQMRPCCKRMWDAQKSVCYGKYRPPSDDDVMFVRGMREMLDKEGIVQRNDAPRSPKLLQLASASTKYFMQQAAQQRKSAVQELILSNPNAYMGDVIKNYGITLNATELDRTLKEGFKRTEDKEIVI